MPPPDPPVFQVHLHCDLFKALAKQVSSAQNFLITGIGNLIDDCDDVAAGICTDSNLAFQLLLRLNDALHSTGDALPVRGAARQGGEKRRDAASLAAQSKQLLFKLPLLAQALLVALEILDFLVIGQSASPLPRLMQGYIVAIGLAFGAGGALHAGDLAHGTFAALFGPADDGVVAAHQRGTGFAVALAAIGVQHHFAAAGTGPIGIFRHQSSPPCV